MARFFKCDICNKEISKEDGFRSIVLKSELMKDFTADRSDPVYSVRTTTVLRELCLDCYKNLERILNFEDIEVENNDEFN